MVFDVKTVFEKYDEDGSGALGADELNHVLIDMGCYLDPVALHEAITKLDAGNVAGVKIANIS